MRRRVIIGLIWAWGAALCLPAQSATPKRVDFEFSVMGMESTRDIGYAQLKPEALSKSRPVAADFDIIPMRINSQGRSDFYRYRGPLPLRFVKIEEAGGGNWRAIRMVGAIRDRSVPPRAMILLAPDPMDETKFSPILLDDSPAGFPVRHARVVNLSQLPVEGQIDGTKFATDNVRNILPPQRVGGSLKVGVAFEKNTRPTVVFDQSLRLRDNERLMLVFLPPFRPGADIRVRIVRDRVHVADPEE